ncbi:gas vesicle protein [Nocardia sp. NPDC059764]|uniref:gas vesicle protein n=1 Tax=Nocardia sp. NPDC059764 TaxID=3346939 RepID=UPI00364B1E74
MIRADAGGGGTERRVALVDLLDRVLAGGVVISGDIKLAIADVDLVQISLRALVSSITGLYRPLDSAPRDAQEEPPGHD